MQELPDERAPLPSARINEVESTLRRPSALLPAIFILLSGVGFVSGAGGGSVRVIANPTVKGTQMTRAALAQIFLKEASKWGDGSPAQPVDQSLKSPVRSTFSNSLLGRSIIEIQIYWQRRMTTGAVPPPVRTTDEEVVSFVAQTPGAIGYVSDSTPLPDTVKALEIAK